MGAPRTIGLLTLAVVMSGCSAVSDPAQRPVATPTAATLTTATPSSVPSISSSPAATSSPTPSPSDVGAQVPAAARAHTAAGAEAFIRFYLSRVNAAWRVPDAGLIKNLADPECGSCANFVKGAERFAANGERYSTDAVELRPSAAELPESTERDFALQGVIVALPAKVVDRRGKVIRTVNKSADLGKLSARWGSGGWRMLEIGYESTGT